MTFIRATALALALLSMAPFVSTARAVEPWLAEAAATKELIPPFQKTLYAGEVARIRVQRSSALRLRAGEGSTPGGISTVVAMKNGDPIADRKSLQQATPLILCYAPQEADSIAIRVRTGILNLEADLSPMDERIVEEGQEVAFSIRPDAEVRGRFVNASDYRTTVFYEFRLREQPASRADENDRYINLDFMNSARDKLWSAEADEIVVEVKKGRAVIKVGQPFLQF